MKKYLSFDRVIIVLILLVLFFTFYRLDKNIVFLCKCVIREQNKQKYSPNYYVYDFKRNELIGKFYSPKTIQEGQIIFVEDDVYDVKFTQIFLKKSKNKDDLYYEIGYQLGVEFRGKEEYIKEKSK